MEIVSLIFWPVMALAFTGAPSKQCKFDRDCVLVRYTYCGTLSSITADQDAKFVAWEKKDSDAAREEKRACPKEAKPDPRLVEPSCGPAGVCEVKKR